jgi:hypothetical protein
VCRIGIIHLTAASSRNRQALYAATENLHGDKLSHNTITLTRPHLPLLRPHIQIDRTNQLEERIVIGFRISLFQPLVPPHQQTHEDFDLLEREVETDAHPLAGGETVAGC